MLIRVPFPSLRTMLENNPQTALSDVGENSHRSGCTTHLGVMIVDLAATRPRVPLVNPVAHYLVLVTKVDGPEDRPQVFARSAVDQSTASAPALNAQKGALFKR